MDMTNPVFHSWFSKLDHDLRPVKKKPKEPVQESKKPKSRLDKTKAKKDIKEKKEDKEENKSLIDFATKRHAGAEKITNTAKEKGGAALLTYHHFKVKLPYYKKMIENKVDFNELAKEYQELITRLNKYSEHIESINQTAFQELVGKIEVIGELLIRQRN